ncbi:MAG: Kelch repeat-containing protein [Polyangiales bacterium]
MRARAGCGGRYVFTWLLPVLASASSGCSSKPSQTQAPPREQAAQRVAQLRGRLASIGAVAKTAAFRSASTELPSHADGVVLVRDDSTRIAVRFALEGAKAAPLERVDGIAIYRGALEGADLVHRVHAQGTEDYVAFETKPAREELRYRVDVSRASGLRLVSNTLELLDETGTPRLRVAPPYLVDAHGVTHEARLELRGCAYDTDPRPPFGRSVTKAGADWCAVRVSWSGASYPLIVDPAWTTTGSMATARMSHTATLLGSGKVLVAGGHPSGGTSDIAFSTAEIYDGTSSFAATGAMTSKRYQHAATLLPSGKVLLAGGHGAAILSTAELYDETKGTFAATSPMTTVRWEVTATLMTTGKVLLTGGSGGGSSAEIFDGVGTFTATGSMKSSRWAHTATALSGGKVLVVGGNDGSGFTSSAEIFDGVGTFTATGFMAEVRGYHAATALPSGKVLVTGGGESGNGSVPPLSTAELFDGVGAFVSVGPMIKARQFHTATLLPSGKVLVAGGGFPISTAELFDPTTGFTAIGAMSAPRAEHTATLLASGNVLVTGGSSDVGGLLTQVSSAEIFALVATGTCVSGAECVSGVCQDGNCCAGPCAGTCMTCLPVTGACVSVKNADDPDSCAGTQTCSAAGSCLLKPGQATASATACASGIADDGFCCSGACGGTCQTCAGSGACVSVTGDDPDTCNGTNTCSASGVCLLKNGQPATTGASCASGFAIDGVCCDTACTGTCRACTKALKGSGADGVCGFVATSTDPRTSCPGRTCSGSLQDDGHTCDGAGGCIVTTTTSCAPYLCNDTGTACLAAVCTSDANCTSTSYCASGTCTAKHALGASCTANDQCVAGHCVDGVCCDSACAGSCQACQLAATGSPDGTCALVKDGKDPRGDCPGGSCTGATLTNNVCDGTGKCRANTIDCAPGKCATSGSVVSCATTCTLDSDCDAGAYCDAKTCKAKLARGVACAANSQCSSGFCADSVCCDRGCNAECEACAEPTSVGTCIPIKGAPRSGRPSCNGTDPACAGSCDGIHPATCAYPSVGTSCGSGCVDGKLAVCDNTGTCLPPAGCPSNFACDGATKCKTSCTENPDCASGFICSGAKCVPAPKGTCSADGESTTATDGTVTQCAPYRCDPSIGTCKASCATTSDCATGTTCDTSKGTGLCVATAETESGGGCVFGSSTRGSFIGIGIALALAAARRRRVSRG